MVQLARDKNKAYVTILTVVVLMFIVMTITITVITVLIDTNLNYGWMSNADMARNNADACAEVAINKLKESLSYAGGETITLTYGNCQITSVTGSGNLNRVITTESTYNNVTRKVQVTISTVNAVTVISSWLELNV